MTTRLGGVVLVVLLCLATAACDPASDPASDEADDGSFLDDAGAVQEPAEVSEGPEPVEPVGEDLRVVELGEPDDTGEVTVTVRPGDVSLLFVATGSDLDDQVEILDVVTPDGSLVRADDLATPVGFGEHALLLPLSEDRPLVPGDYVVIVDSDGGVSDTRAVIKSGPLADLQAIDVSFAVVSDIALEANQAQRDRLAEDFRRAGDAVLAAHGMTVGGLTFTDHPDLVEEHGELDLPSDGTDLALRELCLALDEPALDDTALDDPALDRSLTIAIVDTIVDTADPEGETEGISPGLPGAAVLPDASTGCVAMVADGSRPITELPAVVWHEAGHLMGLPHTTEADGEVFDLFDDTPECPAEPFDGDDDGFVDATECPDGGNLMFHDSDALQITAQQAFLLRHHPLLYPAG